MTTRALGVCYYPEQWPETMWAADAAHMAAIGLTWVRIGEFAWSQLEPTPGDLQFDWLIRAIDTLKAAGLKVILGTPTATPPRWMIDRHPDMLAVDAQGRPRKFGSRRHYCFSHEGYRADAVRITRIMAEKCAQKVDAWQTDNEYGCHETTISYSDAARTAFQTWCANRYGSIKKLNTDWGNIFWSMEYNSFDQIDLPNLTVTEANPAHALAFRRFTSDQVVAWNAAQVSAIKEFSDAPISHNYMGRITDFDHFDVGADLDFATWDSYPMGFLEDRITADPAFKRAYMRQGHPDFQAFHHDLYRAVGKGRWWIMEQQPGPVNWAPANPAPLPGMVRLWAWEAFAHGAETVCYFRWRQAPFAQEQQHAGLLLSDNSDATGMREAIEVAKEIQALPDIAAGTSPVALIFDYTSQWAWEVQPQGAAFDYFELVFDLYRALRRAGLSIDILPPDTPDLSAYKLVLVPGLLTLSDPLRTALNHTAATVLTGPRTDLKTAEISTKLPLGPDLPGLSCKVTHIETFRPDVTIPLTDGGAFRVWQEHVETKEKTEILTQADDPALIRAGTRFHLCGWPDDRAADHIISTVAQAAGLPTEVLPEGLRIRDAGGTRYVMNYSAEPHSFKGYTIAPADLIQLKLNTN